MIRKGFRHVLGSLISIIAFAVMASAQSAPQTDFSNVKIKNFGQMDERFYRGAQPKETDYKDLAALGIKTVIDLTDSPKSYEKTIAESLGMHYVNIPIADKTAPTDASVAQFLKLVDDPATGKFYVHCAGGRHRTGTMGAIYRFTQNHWTFDQVYAEMKDYDFYTSRGHGGFKDYLESYWSRIQSQGYPNKLGVFDTNAALATAVTASPSRKK
jgi:tyrosine-protein phosphatase SIW14